MEALAIPPCLITEQSAHAGRGAWKDEESNAASEDRTHDLRIMRPTRYQLRYRRPYDLDAAEYISYSDTNHAR